jgi:20S proteasome alpha/beta subunit
MNFDDKKRLVPYQFKPPQFAKCERKSVTILTGIICQDAIVLASDSQMTDIVSGDVSYIDKIGVVNFVAGQALVAQAGLPSITNRVVETMREKAHGIKVTDWRIVTQIAEDSIRETKIPLDAEQKTYLRDNGSALMLAFYAAGKPHLYTIDISGSGTVNPAGQHYATAGMGVALANYLLSEFTEPRASSDIGIAASIYVIKKVKDNNRYCGGDTTVKVVRRISVPGWNFQITGRADTVAKHFVNIVERRLVKMDEKAKPARNKRIISILRQEAERMRREKIKKLQAASKRNHEKGAN